jgi:hypothetical protein
VHGPRERRAVVFVAAVVAGEEGRDQRELSALRRRHRAQRLADAVHSIAAGVRDWHDETRFVRKI